MLDTPRMATAAVMALLMVTVTSCTSREKPDGISTGSAYIQTPEGSYVPIPAQLAGYSAAPTPPPVPASAAATPPPTPPR